MLSTPKGVWRDQRVLVVTVAAVLASLQPSMCAALSMLAWDPSPAPNVAGYELHVGRASGIYEYAIDAGAATRHPLPPLASGHSHYFAVRAYDTLGTRSAFSNEFVLSRADGDAVPLGGDFAASPLVGVAPHTVFFTPSASGAILWYRWELGDGTSYTSDAVTPLPVFMHTFRNPGAYAVTLTVAGPGGVRPSQAPAPIIVVSEEESAGCPCTVFGAAIPDLADDGSTGSTNVGMRFTPSRSGVITGIRFYKSAANAGPHTGALWTAAGERLASVAFNDAGSTSGWQQADLATPVRVNAGSSYVVSYHAPTGRVARDGGAFLKRIVSGPLTVPPGRVGSPNGLRADGPASTFPSAGDKQANFWVDVVFVPAS